MVAALASPSARAASNLQFLPSIEAFFFHDGNVAVTGSNATSDQVGRLQANLNLQSRSRTTQWDFGYSIYRENFKDLSELDNTGMWLATRYRKDTSRRNKYDLGFFAVRTERQRIREETIEDPENLVRRVEQDRLRFVANGRVESGKRSFVRWTGAARVNRYAGDDFTDSDNLDLGVGWGYEVSRKADLGVVYGYSHLEFEHSGATPVDPVSGLPLPPPPTTNTHLLDLAFDYELGPKAGLRAFVGIQSYDEDGGNSDTVPSFDFRVRREVTRGSNLLFGVKQGISTGTGRGGATQDYGGYVSWNYRPGRNYRVIANATYWHRERVGAAAQGSGNQGFRTLSRFEWTPGEHVALGVFHSYVDQNGLTTSAGDTSYNTGGINVRWDIKGRSGRGGSLGR